MQQQKSRLKDVMPQYLSQHFPLLSEEKRSCWGCGSCYFNEYTYEQQLETKQQWIQNLFKEKGLFTEQINIIESPKKKRYRNKMDYVAFRGRIGLRKGGPFNVYDVIDSCIADDKSGEILRKLREFTGYEYYDLRSHTGVIRYFVIRTAEHEGKVEYMLNVILKEVTPEFISDFEAFLKTSQLYDLFSSVTLSLQPTKSDVSYGVVTHVYKNDHILQDLTVNNETFTFQITANCFFQSNAAVFQNVLEHMAHWSKKIDGSTGFTLFDLFGGMGTIGIALSKYFKNVVTVDIDEANIEMAQINQKTNKVKHYTAIKQDVFEYLKENTDLSGVAIFDPPRPGLGEKTCERFLSLPKLPEYIFYMSCNPQTLADDLVHLTKQYEILEVTAFDMFPSTPHMEAVTILKKKN